MVTFDELLAYETGDIDLEEIVALFQKLIDTDAVWSMSAHYSRTAARLIQAGLCKIKEIES